MSGDQAAPDGWVPEFESQRQPFHPGHQLSPTTHGAYSPRKFEPLAQEILTVLLTDPSVPAHAKAQAYRLELLALCRAEAKVQLISEWLEDQASEEHPMGDLADGAVWAAYQQLHKSEGRAASSRSRLGLTPASAARLGKNVAQAQVAHTDVALRMAELHAAEQRLLEQGWTPPTGPSVARSESAGQPGDQDQDDHHVEEAGDDADR